MPHDRSPPRWRCGAECTNQVPAACSEVFRMRSVQAFRKPARTSRFGMPQLADATNEKGNGFGPIKSIGGARFLMFSDAESTQYRDAYSPRLGLRVTFQGFCVTAAERLD